MGCFDQHNVLTDDFDYILNSELKVEQFKNQNFFVTGATGFIGSLIIRFLLYANYKKNLNIHIYGMVRNLNKADSLYADYPKENLQFVVAHLGKNDLSLEGDIDYIIHTAAVTKSKQMVEDPVGTIKTAVNGTEEILKFAVNKAVKSMVYVSSMEVYGQPINSGKTTEKDLGYVDLTSSRSCYPEGKRMCELLCTAFSDQFGLNVKIARLAQTFGAGVLPSENRVFAQFARSVIKHKDIVLHTEGNSEGNYVYSADAVKALLYLLLKGDSKNAYNVSNENNHTTIKDMAQLVINNFGVKNENVIIDIPKENMGYAPDVHIWLSNEKLRNLGWKPNIDLVDSYSRLLTWLKYLS